MYSYGEEMNEEDWRLVKIGDLRTDFVLQVPDAQDLVINRLHCRTVRELGRQEGMVGLVEELSLSLSKYFAGKHMKRGLSFIKTSIYLL